jgi:hypothetical protein
MPSATNVQRQRLGEGEDRGDDRDVVAAMREPGHERPVDLHDVDGEPLEVAERGVPGAEVVEHETDAEPAQLL